GILPVEYLGTDWPYQALSLLTNARQILAHYQRQMLQKKEITLPFFFWTFKELSPSRQAELMSMVDTLLKQNRYKDAIQVGLKIIEIALKGLAYYQKHDRIALSISILLGFLGWISYVIVLLLRDYTTVGHTSLESSVRMPEDTISKIKCIFVYAFFGSIISFLLYVQNASVMYYAYFLLPVILWMMVSLQWDLINSAKLYIERRNVLYRFISLSVLSFIAVELLVLSFFKREILSFILWAIASWPFFSPLTSPHKKLCFAWCTTCVILSVFPMLPVVGRESNYNLVILAGWLFVLCVGLCARRPETGLILNNRQCRREPQNIVITTAIQVILLCAATFTVQSTASSISNKEGLPLLNQIVSWLILGSSLVLPPFGSQSVLTRLLNVMTSLFAPYILLCISHEGIFCLFLCIQMILWLYLEHHLSYNYQKLQDLFFVSSPTHVLRKPILHELSLADLRRAYFFIFFIFLAFFGTGNIASINSFDPTSVYCFLTIFNPFVMGFLILLKILIPFLIVSCVFRAIIVSLKISPRAMFLLILLMSDFLGLHFFFLVKDSGSWLDIGTSLSHYIISITIIIFIMLLYGLAWFLTSFSLNFPSFKRKRHLL
ncbi:GPI ethanolamine phosphate transferase 1-like, partial [Stegodyphus dumicola]|uniref:GPI ethanolamine phosphate transferase 1-like n=1 Tax=Stegodyphus dumicola TaxID=202533 RepID=UPI0015B084AA